MPKDEPRANVSPTGELHAGELHAGEALTVQRGVDSHATGSAGSNDRDSAADAPTNDFSFRPFVQSDESEVTGWFADAGELRFFAGARLRWPLDSDQWRSLREDPTVSAWTGVLGTDPTPIAHAEMVKDSPTDVRLVRLAVSPLLRGRGIGRAMMPILLAKAREQGFRLVTLVIHPDNTTAIRAYRTFGFEPIDQLDSSGRLLMNLTLDPG